MADATMRSNRGRTSPSSCCCRRPSAKHLDLVSSWRARVRQSSTSRRTGSTSARGAPRRVPRHLPPPGAWPKQSQPQPPPPQQPPPPPSLAPPSLPPPPPPFLERALSAALFALPLAECAYRLALLATYSARRSAADLLVWAGLQREGLLSGAAASADDAAASFAVADWAARAGARLDDALADLARLACEPVVAPPLLLPLARALGLPPALLSADALATAAALAALSFALAAARAQCDEQARRAWQEAARAALRERRRRMGVEQGGRSSSDEEAEEEEGRRRRRRQKQQRQQQQQGAPTQLSLLPPPPASALKTTTAPAPQAFASTPVGAVTRWRPRRAAGLPALPLPPPAKLLAAATRALAPSRLLGRRPLTASAATQLQRRLRLRLQRPELLALSAISALLLRVSLAPIASQSSSAAAAALALGADPALAASALEAAAAAFFSPAVAALTGASGLVALVQMLGLLVGVTGGPLPPRPPRLTTTARPARHPYAGGAPSAPVVVGNAAATTAPSGVPPRRDPLAGAAEMLAAARASARFHLLLAAGDVATAALFGCGALPAWERLRLVLALGAAWLVARALYAAGEEVAGLAAGGVWPRPPLAPPPSSSSSSSGLAAG
jgi:hypothetical protein